MPSVWRPRSLPLDPDRRGVPRLSHDPNRQRLGLARPLLGSVWFWSRRGRRPAENAVGLPIERKAYRGNRQAGVDLRRDQGRVVEDALNDRQILPLHRQPGGGGPVEIVNPHIV